MDVKFPQPGVLAYFVRKRKGGPRHLRGNYIVERVSVKFVMSPSSSYWWLDSKPNPVHESMLFAEKSLAEAHRNKLNGEELR